MKRMHLGLALALLAPAAAHGDQPAAAADQPAATIIFARGGALYAQSDDGKGEATRLAGLADDAAEVRFIEATADGGLVVLDYGPSTEWLVKGSAALSSGPCLARAFPSPKGECVVCPGVDGATLVATTGAVYKALGVKPRELVFRGADGVSMAELTDDGVFGFDRRTPDKTVRLAEAGAKSNLLVSPDGTRAVAVFGDGDASRVKSFLLDGKGVPRQLGGPGVPIVWSWDGVWVIDQEGVIPGGPGEGDEGGEESGSADDALHPVDPWALAAPKKGKKKKEEPPPAPKGPTTRACAVRATGGETKCWDDYIGLAFSPDSTRVLLKKGTSLYVGKIAGVRPEPPVKILDEVDGAATWVPATK